ncbi:hypothetical protein [Ruegeria jejuensis]|uniref:hypothetical protein n=1 Tax=Ruegeria jejuensis TaxID=3233338 RepID=UPI00355B2D10
MDKRTLEALKASIEKWEKNATVERNTEALVGAISCPLCKLFMDSCCRGCPVMERTGKPACDDTPYDDAVEALDVFLPAFHEAARAEVEFLKSLLPEGEQ